MVVEFETEELKELYTTNKLRGKQQFPVQVIRQYRLRVYTLIHIEKLEDLRQLRGWNLEQLKGDRKGQYSLRLNDQYRLILTPKDNNSIKIVLINEISKHYE
jgi:proteic killer suppression protein